MARRRPRGGGCRHGGATGELSLDLRAGALERQMMTAVTCRRLFIIKIHSIFSYFPFLFARFPTFVGNGSLLGQPARRVSTRSCVCNAISLAMRLLSIINSLYRHFRHSNGF